MDTLCAEPSHGTANGTDIVLQWTAAGGRVIESKQKQLFVAPDGTHGIRMGSCMSSVVVPLPRRKCCVAAEAPVP